MRPSMDRSADISGTGVERPPLPGKRAGPALSGPCPDVFRSACRWCRWPVRVSSGDCRRRVSPLPADPGEAARTHPCHDAAKRTPPGRCLSGVSPGLPPDAGWPVRRRCPGSGLQDRFGPFALPWGCRDARGCLLWLHCRDGVPRRGDCSMCLAAPGDSAFPSVRAFSGARGLDPCPAAAACWPGPRPSPGLCDPLAVRPGQVGPCPPKTLSDSRTRLSVAPVMPAGGGDLRRHRPDLRTFRAWSGGLPVQSSLDLPVCMPARGRTVVLPELHHRRCCQRPGPAPPPRSGARAAGPLQVLRSRSGQRRRFGTPASSRQAGQDAVQALPDVVRRTASWRRWSGRPCLVLHDNGFPVAGIAGQDARRAIDTVSKRDGIGQTKVRPVPVHACFPDNGRSCDPRAEDAGAPAQGPVHPRLSVPGIEDPATTGAANAGREASDGRLPAVHRPARTDRDVSVRSRRGPAPSGIPPLSPAPPEPHATHHGQPEPSRGPTDRKPVRSSPHPASWRQIASCPAVRWRQMQRSSDRHIRHPHPTDRTPCCPPGDRTGRRRNRPMPALPRHIPTRPRPFRQPVRRAQGARNTPTSRTCDRNSPGKTRRPVSADRTADRCQSVRARQPRCRKPARPSALPTARRDAGTPGGRCTVAAVARGERPCRFETHSLDGSVRTQPCRRPVRSRPSHRCRRRGPGAPAPGSAHCLQRREPVGSRIVPCPGSVQGDV